MPARANLEDLPLELHWMVLTHLPDEDDQGRLCATSRAWQRRIQAQQGPWPTSPQLAFETGHRHALARALGAAPDASAFAQHSRDGDGMTPIMHAAYHGNRPMLRCLLRHSRGPLSERDNAKLTARHWAAIVRTEHEFDVDLRRAGRRDDSRRLPWPRLQMHDAVIAGHQKLAITLLGAHWAAPVGEWRGRIS